MRIYIDAVAQKGFASQNIFVHQTVYNALSVFL